MQARRTVLAALAVSLAATGAVIAAPASAAPAGVPISGAGSSWVAPAVDQWSVDVRDDGTTVNYDAVGSASGRSEFAGSVDDFAVSDLTFQDVGESPGTRQYAYLPLVAGAVSFPYHLVIDNHRVQDLRLSGPTLAGIFSGRITNWNSAAITADNNGHRIAADLPIVPVVHSDGSATTFRLTEWFSRRFPARWDDFSGVGATQYFPSPAAGTAEVAGSSAVVNYIGASGHNGTIGYDENSYALQANLPAVAIRNSAGQFVDPDPDSVTGALERAKPSRNGGADLLRVYGNADPQAYPLSYYSVGIIPTSAQDSRMTTAKRQAEVDFFGYAVCSGQHVAAAYGFAPLPVGLRRAALGAIAELHAADPHVRLDGARFATCMSP